MAWGEQQAEEIKTIKGRNITLQLSDADCDRLSFDGEDLHCGECRKVIVCNSLNGDYSRKGLSPALNIP